MTERYDVIIIGAGIIGAATALELSRMGRKTLNIDKLPAAGYGSTANSCAIIRTHYSTFDGAALAYEGYFYWKNWRDYLAADDERGLALFHDCGCMVFKSDKNNHLRTICANMAKLDIPFEDLTPEDVRQRMPIYDTRAFAPVRRPDDPAFGQSSAESVAGAVFFPTAGYISDPQLATHNLQRAAEAAGGSFLFNAEVTEIRRADGRVAGVTLADGRAIDAPVVVNVAGPHSYKINEMADVLSDMNIATKALRQEVAHVPSPDGFDYEKDAFVVSDSDVGCYSRPEVGNHILIGSEDPECDEREWVDPDDYNKEFTEQWTAQVYRVAQRIPSLGIPSQLRGVVDLYDVADDWIPIYDKSALAGYYMAIGTSGNQFKNAPVAGAMMAALIDYCEGGTDHDAEPLQFHLKHIDRSIDVGFYSRRREINADSSFSVLG